ncbi:hypothetical protein KTC99_22695 (plasmid) [Clostridium estertheticum]|uniref:hypothetical protein n=1 Tax=Clostridium estertheticum TaxID=238834 RepID=UPI002714D2E6|nr:hypothetical protein [Clostridium estertheticum]WLC77572.1 hypothetical protein KTC99_22695 [Clostridium estertheticum]
MPTALVTRLLHLILNIFQKKNGLNTIDKKESAVLASSPSMGENKIKESFESQKKEQKK